jgi:uncharacterized protein YjbI with pentapeptide repeats
MANDEHVAQLRKGVAAWNEWRQANPDIRADLSGANLREAKLTRGDLSGAKLTRANLIGADLSGANLNKTNLSEANLMLADLVRASKVRPTQALG